MENAAAGWMVVIVSGSSAVSSTPSQGTYRGYCLVTLSLFGTTTPKTTRNKFRVNFNIKLSVLLLFLQLRGQNFFLLAISLMLNLTHGVFQSRWRKCEVCFSISRYMFCLFGVIQAVSCHN